ncbi:hypothetical protein CA13_11060 [Planctomycetes bacterium CA13]|uniref:Outer membrane efflux protein n=1 Tax=Novipirellula herctigrandis TaxID=2527986 RepID=A0A5C5YXB1_9BACT|nr:hypothetical protein CA13_11060 [Planctomycetes bacterium CA13]
MKSRKNLVAALIAFSATSFASALIADDAVKQDSAKTVEARVRELQSERSELLQKRLDQLTDAYENGRTPLDAVLSAEYDLLNARLQSCVTKFQRIESLRPIIKNRMRMEEYRATSFEQGICSEDVLLVARADTLNARITLLRELPPHASLKKIENGSTVRVNHGPAD